MNKILDEIYWHYVNMSSKENPLETLEVKKALNSFFTTYFGHFSNDEYNQAWDRLINVISAYQELAFETGFYARIELMNGNQK